MVPVKRTVLVCKEVSCAFVLLREDQGRTVEERNWQRAVVRGAGYGCAGLKRGAGYGCAGLKGGGQAATVPTNIGKWGAQCN